MNQLQKITNEIHALQAELARTKDPLKRIALARRISGRLKWQAMLYQKQNGQGK